MERAPCELTVADFAATRRAEAANFTNRVWREVIMQHEMLIFQARQPIDHLL